MSYVESIEKAHVMAKSWGKEIITVIPNGILIVIKSKILDR